MVLPSVVYTGYLARPAWMLGLPGLSVERRKRTWPKTWVSRLTSRRPSTWPMKSGRSRLTGADQSVALPVGDGEKLRRDDIERRSLRHEGSRRIGVVATAELDRGFDQETAGVITDRAERIVVDPQALARRLARDRAGHCGRDRRLVG